MAFRDIGWLTERTTLWDAIGVLAYGMVFAFTESVLIFIGIVILGFLVPKKWNEQRIALLSMLILVLATWSMLDQTLFILNIKLPVSISQFLLSTRYPIRYMLISIAPVIFLTFALPAYYILQSDKGFRAAKNITERIKLLSMLYLFFGFIGLIIVIIRNL